MKAATGFCLAYGEDIMPSYFANTRKACVDDACANMFGESWAALRKLGYRVIRVRVEAAGPPKSTRKRRGTEGGGR